MRQAIEQRIRELRTYQRYSAGPRAYADRHIARWTRVLGGRYSKFSVYADGRFDGAT